LFSRAFSRLPQKLQILNLVVEYHSDSILLQIPLHEATLNPVSKSGNAVTFEGNYQVNNSLIYNHRIAEDTVAIDNIRADFRFSITSNSITLDSSSVVRFNNATVHPFAYYISTPEKEYCLKLHTDPVNAQQFFSSLPAGLFNDTRDIKADGELQYSLFFKLNSAMPDSVEFESQLKKSDFKIHSFGKENLGKMNGEFLYTAYEYGRPFKSFLVGPSNPYFTPLEEISPHLRHAILTSEDGSFFYHNGFNEESFRRSIAENYKKGKFARGGSTISMQLVKNVFLSRRKTISRKAEEALIVWLIESNRISSKSRMFEVYLNIIELGPGVYGIGEASLFYFNKKPSELTLSESIFIASLLPRPKWFKYSFDAGGNLKPYLEAYYRVVANFLLRKELITEEEYQSIQPHVELKGPARLIVVPSDTIPAEEDTEDEF
jgi:hypothetical protein